MKARNHRYSEKRYSPYWIYRVNHHRPGVRRIEEEQGVMWTRIDQLFRSIGLYFLLWRLRLSLMLCTKQDADVKCVKTIKNEKETRNMDATTIMINIVSCGKNDWAKSNKK